MEMREMVKLRKYSGGKHGSTVWLTSYEREGEFECKERRLGNKFEHLEHIDRFIQHVSETQHHLYALSVMKNMRRRSGWHPEDTNNT